LRCCCCSSMLADAVAAGFTGGQHAGAPACSRTNKRQLCEICCGESASAAAVAGGCTRQLLRGYFIHALNLLMARGKADRAAAQIRTSCARASLLARPASSGSTALPYLMDQSLLCCLRRGGGPERSGAASVGRSTTPVDRREKGG
jgi:hypothetical protein